MKSESGVIHRVVPFWKSRQKEHEQPLRKKKIIIIIVIIIIIIIIMRAYCESEMKFWNLKSRIFAR